ncbi:alpha/beta fold hydrolase [Methylovirgula sp. 4M-Z18]|uniref:alpha/beta fold hydrolase n=1 Tax=Methylovirgula sp. 4M-Z18 TaxID=2293567 RepID=UPI000E2E624C|nr:alpha/beta hydrolase [Methylovirgula sp. 4M-Z18]RFB78830.1 alpha/beta hydrolase [Methylovirgula sp. 4M-Z18]
MSDTHDLFPGFASHWIDTEAGKIFARSGGSGPPLVLLHGFPQTHVMWHRVAAQLAEHFTVVAMDLRGYGWSAVPRSHGGEAYTKRAMGEDVVAVMAALGHVRFRVAGHDRGARVAYRLALDHPGCVEKLALLDIEPTFIVWEQREDGGDDAPHWPWLARPEPQPEQDIARDPRAYGDDKLIKWSKAHDLGIYDSRALAAYRQSFTDPLRIHAYCEDYRAGANQDRAQDEEDMKQGKTISCPVHVICGNSYLAGAPLATWRRTFAPEATGVTLDSGHFLAEENAAATLAAMKDFLL